MPTPVTTAYAEQSSTISEVMDAFSGLLAKALGWAASRVVEWHSEKRPITPDPGRSIVWFRFVTRRNDSQEAGPGRHGIREEVILEVNLATRMFGDGAQKDKRLVRKHIAMQLLIENAVVFRELFKEYSAREGLEPPKPVAQQWGDQERLARRAGTAGPYRLTVAPMCASELPAPERPRPEQGYFESRIGVSVPCVLRVTLNEAQEIDAEA